MAVLYIVYYSASIGNETNYAQESIYKTWQNKQKYTNTHEQTNIHGKYAIYKYAKTMNNSKNNEYLYHGHMYAWDGKAGAAYKYLRDF